MAASNFSELKAAIADWLHRSDLAAVIPDFILLAEERFNRRLRTRFQETSLSSTAINSSYQIAIPSNTLAVKNLWRVAGVLNFPLQAATLEYIVNRHPGSEATAYAWEGSTWRFDGTGNVAGILYRSIPDLATNSTNWLLTANPSLYLFASLAEAANYCRDTEAETIWRARSEAMINEMNRVSQADAFSGPLTVRAA